MALLSQFDDWHDDITAWRRDLHAHPELKYDTHRTSAFVADRLRAFGCDEVVEGIGRTGVVGLIHGQQGLQARTIGLRADMDALPIQEATGAPHASVVPGKMHACGHDGHTAMLLGAARYLAETRAFSGTVAVIFQPAEEGGAGAAAMVEDGLMTRFGISEVYGLHNSPLLPFGQFAIRSGPFYAAVDSFRIDVRGRGGHAARPHQTVDTTLAASAIVMALQSIVARNTDPQQPVVVSVTAFHTEGDAFNVIPDGATLRGTLRSFDGTVRDATLTRMAEVIEATAQAYGATARLHQEEEPYPVMVNHGAETEHCVAAATQVVGTCDDNAPRTTGGEDFAYMLEACPGAYIQLGIGHGPGLHHPAYDFNDAIIPIGCSYWVTLAEARLAP
ncbi:amidohydrolase [Jannaschia pagri]|uniref:Amidohydrolase n=1 Tax=Jannaschia pagri TaxID=2829797 RepID=A0ABQ4NNR8_9RHOB|nr:MULTISPECIES: M20 aminoacylase family protein [unclassified Jannaschia]GIT92030.1 amidohydrolase [Jannaschia sp. AI_61]GIT95864.1 amidohydrolase [Jannaschia sp. AI_62]